ncbi:hypothetical protein AAD001_03565 [Colwelliaceae bacterium 6471]
MLTLALYAAKTSTSFYVRGMLRGRKTSVQVTALPARASNIVGWVIKGVHRFINATVIEVPAYGTLYRL